MNYLIGKIMGTDKPIGKAFSDPPNTLFRITVLVVDDDNTSLAIVSAMLREWRYEVTSVKNPIDALSIIRARPTCIDIVVTDLHMPEMSGIELQRQINREFQLPVIIMSSDDQESVMLESLWGGAVFFIVKPVNPEQLKNVWQYAIAAKKGKSVMIEEIRSFHEGESSSSAGKRSKGLEVIPVSSAESNDRKVTKRGTKRKVPPVKNKNDDEEDEVGSAPKKAKIVWTNKLHNQFLNALRHIGMDKAVPKKILEFMGVPGLTRENVASHLQKYRMFLRRLAERNSLAARALAESILRSSFASSHPELLRAAQDYAQWTDVQRTRALAYQPATEFGGTGGSSTISPYNAASPLASILFPNQNASSNNLRYAQQFGYGQSRLLGSNQDNNRRLFSGNTTCLHRNNRLGYGNRTNLSLNGGSSSGMTSARNGLTNGANYYMQKYQQQFQARPSFNYGAGSSSSSFRYGSNGLHSANPNLPNGNMGTMGNSFPSPNSSWINNYSNNRSRLPSYGQLQMGQNNLLNSGGYGSMNFTSTENQAFGYKDRGGSSSAGSFGANQALSPAYGGEANTPVFPGLDNNSARATSDNSVHLTNNAPTFDNIDISSPQRPQQLGGGYLNDAFLQSNNNNTSSQQRGEAVQNLDFLDNVMFPEVYPTLEDLLNIDFSEALSLEDRDDEQAVDQVPSGNDVQLMETDANGGDGGGSSAPSNESNPTDPNNQIINQQQSGGGGLTNFDLEALQMNYNTPATNDGAANDNQINWDEDLLNSLLFFNPDELD